MNIFTNTRCRQCTYQSMKHLVKHYKKPRTKIYFIIDSVLMFYGYCRLIPIAYLMKNNYQIEEYYFYKIERDDPFVNFLKQHADQFNESLPIVFMGLALFHYLCQVCLYRLDVRKQVWQWWYQALVTNQDYYHQFKLNDYHMIKRAKANKIRNRLHQHRFASIFPGFIMDGIASLCSAVVIQLNLEHIDRDKFFKKKLSYLPNLPKKIRIRLVNVVVIGDYFWFYFQIIIGIIQKYYLV